MENKEKLTGADYATLPFVELAIHPNYNRHASKVMTKILDLTSEELAQLDCVVLEVRMKREL